MTAGTHDGPVARTLPKRFYKAVSVAAEGGEGAAVAYRILLDGKPVRTPAKAPLAVRITGGFHSPKITEALEEQGLGVIVVTPKIGQPTEGLYQAVLKYKSGHGDFEEVMTRVQPTGQGVTPIAGGNR